MPLPRILRTLFAAPTAPFVENAIMEIISGKCRRLPGVTCRADRHGNLLARYRFRPRGRSPLVFAAHTDHPGFVALEMTDRRTLRAAFRGGVRSDYFEKARVRFWTGKNWVRARVLELTRTVPMPRLGPGVTRPVEALLRVASPVPQNAPGMWDRPEPRLRGDLILATACDDLAGVGALLELLSRLSRKRPRADVIALFTRAEEVGFVGGIAAAREETVPRDRSVITVEMSKALPNAPIGDGPILRVGDRLTLFDPDLTAYCGHVAQNLARRRRKFAFQRKLMDGGACESSAYAAYGYRTTGICLPLGNYHNMDTERGRIAQEFISLADWRHMVDWFEALVLDEAGFQPGAVPALRGELDRLFGDHEALLSAPASRATKP